MNLGLCGGIGGTPRFLLDLIPVIEDTDPALAQACRNACEVFAEWFQESAIPFGKGRAWRERKTYGDGNAVSIALDYGLTGQIICVHDLHKGLGTQELKDLEADALKALLSLAVKKDDGYKWPFITRIEETEDAREKTSNRRDRAWDGCTPHQAIQQSR